MCSNQWRSTWKEIKKPFQLDKPFGKTYKVLVCLDCFLEIEILHSWQSKSPSWLLSWAALVKTGCDAQAFCRRWYSQLSSDLVINPYVFFSFFSFTFESSTLLHFCSVTLLLPKGKPLGFLHISKADEFSPRTHWERPTHGPGTPTFLKVRGHSCSLV